MFSSPTFDPIHNGASSTPSLLYAQAATPLSEPTIPRGVHNPLKQLPILTRPQTPTTHYRSLIADPVPCVLGVSDPGVLTIRILCLDHHSHSRERRCRIWGRMQSWPDVCDNRRMRTAIAWDTGFGYQSPVDLPASAYISLLLL